MLAAGVCVAGLASLMPQGRAQGESAPDLAHCAAIPVDADRLACYDRLARNNPTADRSSSAPPSERPDQSFGMTKPPSSKPPEPSRIEAKVFGITTDSRGTTVVKLDNEQTWTIDDGPAMLRAGDAVVIKRAALGSFLMTTPTSRIYRVRRLQ